MLRYIWIKNKRYFHYETYESAEEAQKIARYFRKKNKCRFFIIKKEEGLLFRHTVWELYLDKVFRFW